MLSTSSHMAVGGSREAVYASTATLHASPVVSVQVAECTYWTALLNCRRARGHDSGHMAKSWPTRSSLAFEAPLNSRSALDKREVSFPVEEGARGEVAERCIAKKCAISKWERRKDGTMHYGQ